MIKKKGWLDLFLDSSYNNGLYIIQYKDYYNYLL